MRSWISGFAAVTLAGAFLALSVLALGCGGDKGTGSATGSIAGTVYRAGTGTPVTGALVLCAGVSGTTDSKGAYKLENVPVGRHTLTATKTNYEVFTTTVNVTSSTTQNIFIVYKGGDGGGIGE